MIITVTDLKNDLSTYLTMVQKEDVYITKNGKKVAKLVGADGEKTTSITDNLAGILKGRTSLSREEVRKERLERKYG